MQIKKFFLIAWKDIRLVMRDKSALMLMLLAPFILTLGLGAISGRFSVGNVSGISNIPVVIVNDDEGVLGGVLLDVFKSPELEDLVEPTLLEDTDKARTLVDEGQFAAMIYIPDGFTDSTLPITGIEHEPDDVAQISFYANPTSPTSCGILYSILSAFINQVEIGRVSSEVIVPQLIEGGWISPDQAVSVGTKIGWEMAMADNPSSTIQIINETAPEGEAIQFDVLAYMAPGMAVMFLMFTVANGGRSLLLENRLGTLPRLLISPTFSGYVLGGKALGIFLKGFAQLIILILGTSLLFRLEWGDPLGVFLLIFGSAFAATGWGMLFAAILKTPGQIAVTGSAVMLLFGILGGSFFDISLLPGWVSVLNKITPNAWAIEGFYILSIGGKLNHILPNILALIIMGITLLIFAAIWIHRNGLARK